MPEASRPAAPQGPTMRLAPGAVARRSRPVTARDIELFTELTGDRNPLHYDDAAGRGHAASAASSCRAA